MVGNAAQAVPQDRLDRNIRDVLRESEARLMLQYRAFASCHASAGCLEEGQDLQIE